MKADTLGSTAYAMGPGTRSAAQGLARMPPGRSRSRASVLLWSQGTAAGPQVGCR